MKVVNLPWLDDHTEDIDMGERLLPKRFYEFNYNPQLQQYREQEGHFTNINHMLALCAEHTIDRIKERYNFSMTAQDWERLNWMIFREYSPRERQENVRRLFVKSDDSTIYEVVFQPWSGRKRKLWVMFSEKCYCIMTAIPPEDIRIQVAERGDYKDIDHTFSKLLKRRYDLLLTHQNQRYGYNHAASAHG